MRAFEKIDGYSSRTGILVGGWRQSVRKRKVTKERDVKILFKTYVILFLAFVCFLIYCVYT